MKTKINSFTTFEDAVKILKNNNNTAIVCCSLEDFERITKELNIGISIGKFNRKENMDTLVNYDGKIKLFHSMKMYDQGFDFIYSNRLS